MRRRRRRRRKVLEIRLLISLAASFLKADFYSLR